MFVFFFMSEYKKAKQELKKATAETNKWQKKVKKGELGEHSLQLKLDTYGQYSTSHTCKLRLV